MPISNSIIQGISGAGANVLIENTDPATKPNQSPSFWLNTVTKTLFLAIATQSVSDWLKVSANPSWESITNKPSVFPAANPSWESITNKPSVFPANVVIESTDPATKPNQSPSFWFNTVTKTLFLAINTQSVTDWLKVSGQSVSAQPSVEWTPSNITTQLWLDASDSSTITLVAGAVSQWNDKSGNARNASAAGSTNRPFIASSGLNGKNVIRFSGAPQRLIIPTFSSSQPFNVFLVAKVGNTAGFEVIIDSYNDVRFPIAKNPTSGNRLYVGANGSTDIFDTVTRSDYFIINASANGQSSALRVNAGTAINGGLGTNSYSGLSIGERRGDPTPASNDNLMGDIAEIIFISGTTTTDIRQRTEGYLAHKWGLSSNLPSDHPYKTTRPFT